MTAVRLSGYWELEAIKPNILATSLQSSGKLNHRVEYSETLLISGVRVSLLNLAYLSSFCKDFQPCLPSVLLKTYSPT